ncbi:RloB domain-containing protein [uncultured Eubacterium sp.]|uniref:RloB domain-containing protein n=1 Tax=uncultured Eubacterium sp. TaxID=165185 RepID=UPI002599291E|nr:RloB domain-containing protein [uncultured Eubacterium sp.]
MERLETKKFVFTVEGQTEQWYLFWLQDQINSYDNRTYNLSVNVKVQRHPRKFYKTVNVKNTPYIYHVCDIESSELGDIEKFKNILAEMKEAKTQKKIAYKLGYSNLTFELWIILHKQNCNNSYYHRKQYLDMINKIFDEKFDDLTEYKHEKEFKRCLNKLTLDDVIKAIQRADAITCQNEKDNKLLEKSSGYEFYRDNPALSIHNVISVVLKECGII